MSWKRIACFTDIHWGKGGDDKGHNEDCLLFVEWFLTTAESRKCDAIAFLGDWHDARNKIGVETLNYSKVGIDLFANANAESKFFIIGNHDMYFRENRSIDSLPFLDMYPQVVKVIEPVLIDDTAFVPYLVAEDKIEEVVAKTSRARYVFGHFEFPGFMMDGHNVMPDKADRLKADSFDGPEMVFSGHFHKRQHQRRSKADVWYIGNCFPHDFGDAGDTNRGMMILEKGGRPDFIDWPDMPSYHRVRPSGVMELIDTLGAKAKRAKIQIVPDPSMTREERDEIAAAAVSAGAGRVVLVPPAKAVDEPMEFEGVDVDTSIVRWLSEQKNVGELDCSLLVDLYREA